VDDNRDAASSLGLLLKLLGAEVRVVNDGPTALEALSSYRPTVVLLDIGMPGMDGYEVARQIRAQPQWRDLTLIALTGWGQEDDRERSRQAGFDHHLIKPADMTALKSLLVSPGSGEQAY
jgi:CheY-like chemotaxis protein